MLGGRVPNRLCLLMLAVWQVVQAGGAAGLRPPGRFSRELLGPADPAPLQATAARSHTNSTGSADGSGPGSGVSCSSQLPARSAGAAGAAPSGELWCHPWDRLLHEGLHLISPRAGRDVTLIVTPQCSMMLRLGMGGRGSRHRGTPAGGGGVAD
jgi:hypothetical protein